MENCIFCKIIAKEIPAKIMYEDENMMIICDIDKKAENHYLLLPKTHFASVLDMTSEQSEVLRKCLLKIKDLKTLLKLDGGFRMIINQGENAGQSVFHLHVHILSGQKMGWTPA